MSDADGPPFVCLACGGENECRVCDEAAERWKVKMELAATERAVLEAQARLDRLKQERAAKLPGRPGLENPWVTTLAWLRRRWKEGHRGG
jgi:hypothetical protein